MVGTDGGGAGESPNMKNENQEPWLKRLMDNPWLLLVLGVVIPFLSYTVWGWIELGFVKPATLP